MTTHLRTAATLLAGATLLTGCDMLRGHPYDTDISGHTGLTAANTAMIESRLQERDSIVSS